MKLIYIMNFLEKHKKLLEEAIGYYYGDDVFQKYFGRIPQSRYHTFNYCYEYFKDKKDLIILELGTSRSFVDGRFEGCNSDNIKYWECYNPEKWDWSAGCFTKVFSNLFPDSNFHTVDINSNHIQRSKIMNSESININFFIQSSEEYLSNLKDPVDLIYLDTGDMTPIEETAQLHLREAKIIVEKNLVKENGLILIDDVMSCVPKQYNEESDLGKAKYSIPYFLENGFEIVKSEYQYILRKKKNIKL
jgi:hypothetical protein